MKHKLRFVCNIPDLSIGEQQNVGEHVEYLTGGLMDGRDDRLVRLSRIFVHYRHQAVSDGRIQT